MRLSYRIAVIAVLCLAGLAGCQKPVSAANGLTISPPLKEVTLGPGLLETTTDVTLENNTEQPVRASLQLVDLRALGQYGGTTLDKAGLTGKYDLANWLTLPGGDSIVIASKQTVKVTVKIDNRKDLAPGGHYGAVVITTSADSNSTKSEVSVNQQLISLLFIKKLGGEVYGLQLESSSFDKTSGIPKSVNTTFKNTGNLHVVPRGYIEVTDPSGKVVAKGSLNEDSNNILPGTSRKYATTLRSVGQSTKQGKYSVTTYYRYDGEKDFRQFSQSFKRGNSYTLLFVTVAALAILIVAGVVYVIKRKPYKAFKKHK